MSVLDGDSWFASCSGRFTLRMLDAPHSLSGVLPERNILLYPGMEPCFVTRYFTELSKPSSVLLLLLTTMLTAVTGHGYHNVACFSCSMHQDLVLMTHTVIGTARN